jgi:ABC-type lipoprotein export system ATPase subunit
LPPQRFHANIRDLSGGERARVAIAKAYAAERPICLADEILPALDEATRIAIIDLFQWLAGDGFTVVVIAHQPNLMDRFHRVIEVKDGQVVNDVRHRAVVSGPMPTNKP